MNTAVPILIFIGLGAVVAILLMGLVDLAKGKPDRTRSNKLMQWRVILQGVLILVILVVVLISRGHS